MNYIKTVLIIENKRVCRNKDTYSQTLDKLWTLLTVNKCTIKYAFISIKQQKAQ